MAIKVTYVEVALDDLVMEPFQRRTDPARVREYVPDADSPLTSLRPETGGHSRQLSESAANAMRIRIFLDKC